MRCDLHVEAAGTPQPSPHGWHGCCCFSQREESFDRALNIRGPDRNRKEPDMELVMGGLLIGVSGMLILLIVAAWKGKETGSH
ncbi:MAG: hypothetical protein OJF47_002511 [Nitrospira sp.]|nr:MAG: hypothetical protein OJF47_002511 [Nitrospira sp.]